MEQRLRRYRSHRDLTACGRVEDGVFHSRWYRGLRGDMEWLRLSLELDADACVRVYACDNPEAWDENNPPSLERTARDLLLYGVRGQYLRFTVTPCDALSGYELTFPGNSISALLPMVMQRDETLRQLLGVLQSLYMDTNQALRAFPGRLDPMGPDPLPGLDNWLGAAHWLREGAPTARLLSAAPLLTRLRGTRKGLDLLLELLNVRGATLIEQSQWRGAAESAAEREDCTRLYGGAPVSAALLLPPDTSGETARLVGDLLEDFIPLGVACAVVRLEDGAALDGHSYLDVNVQLTEPPPSRMDEAELGTLTLE